MSTPTASGRRILDALEDGPVGADRARGPVRRGDQPDQSSGPSPAGRRPSGGGARSRRRPGAGVPSINPHPQSRQSLAVAGSRRASADCCKPPTSRGDLLPHRVGDDLDRAAMARVCGAFETDVAEGCYQPTQSHEIDIPKPAGGQRPGRSPSAGRQARLRGAGRAVPSGDRSEPRLGSGGAVAPRPAKRQAVGEA